MEKIFVVLYNAYEFDDLDYGSPYLIYCSLDPKKAQEKFIKCVQMQKKSFEQYVRDNKEWVDSHQEDYQIYTDTENEFEIWFGKWAYYYKLTSYDLDKDLR